MTLLPAMNASDSGRHTWAPTNSANLYGGSGGVCVCVCLCVCARTSRARAFVRDVFAIYDNTI